MSKTTSQRNNAIDLFRYVCAVLIVNIHAHPLLKMNETANYIVVEHVSRIAVPFFFLVSGFYFSLRYYAGKKPYGSYIKKLFLIYTMWSVVYAIEVAILRGGFTMEMLKEFLLRYLYIGVSQHLWFCLALMIAISVLALACRLRAEKVLMVLGIVLFIAGCLGDTERVIGNHIPLLREMYQLEGYVHIQRYAFYGNSFVILGNVIARHRERLLSLSDRTLVLSLCASLLATIAERYAANRFGWAGGVQFNIFLLPLMLTLFVLLLKHPLTRLAKAGAFAGAVATFMYYFHPIILDTVNYHQDRPFRAFVIAVFVCTVVGVGLKALNNKTVSYWLL